MFFLRWKVTWPVLTFRSYGRDWMALSVYAFHLGEMPASTHLHVDLVTAEHDGDVLADTLEITVPVGDVLVGDAGGDVEHDDTALALDVVTVTKATELLLPSGIPHVEADSAEVGGEREGMYFHTEGG